MLVDAHCHLDPELDLPGLIRAVDRSGIDSAVLIAAAQESIGPIRGARAFTTCMHVPALRKPMYRVARRSRVLRPIVRPDNQAVLDASATDPRFIPFAFLNPTLGQEAHDELDRCIAQGARGVKLHPWFHDFRLVDSVDLLERCEDLRLPVVAHLGFGPAHDVAAVLDRCPKLKLIVAHAGIPHFEALWRMERVVFDTAATGLLMSSRTVARMVEAVGVERVVFGSDAPIGIRDGTGHAYRLPPLPDATMGRNLLRLFD